MDAVEAALEQRIAPDALVLVCDEAEKQVFPFSVLA
jgi:hypothetical protein